jgi:hypothetical protein
MPASRTWKVWLRFPSRLALTLGLGAAAVGGARADTPADHERIGPGDVLIRSEGGKIYLSEGGAETELRLGATPERDRLLRLLQDHGPAGVKLDLDPRLIMSSGGGAGFFWWGTRKSASDKPTPALQNPPQVPAPPTPGLAPGANPGSPPRDLYPTTDKKG